jgi:hypothetical protein
MSTSTAQLLRVSCHAFLLSTPYGGLVSIILVAFNSCYINDVIIFLIEQDFNLLEASCKA